ncbi:MAG: hypothetical protein NXY59_03845 [Aigarchaeota archaeon]|nr:hypothetical protein [Candidatus Pelearchaeum maunauluense]
MDKLVLVLATFALAAGLYVSNIQIGVTLGQELGLTAKYVDGQLPITSPDSTIWGEVEAKEVELGPQLTAAPWIHPKPSIRSLRVRVIHNGTWVSFLLEWNDATKDDKMLTDTFRDSAAVMLALQPGAGQCMGTPTAEVVIAHWKADWQRDVNEVFTDISELYPNFWSDWYPFAVGDPPYTLPNLMNLSTAKEYFAGWYVGNPLSTPLKLTPVETLVAHGWGTLTTYAFQSFIGRGIHDGAKWSVVISRPISPGQADPPWGDGGPVEVVSAV